MSSECLALLPAQVLLVERTEDYVAVMVVGADSVLAQPVIEITQFL